MEKSNRDSSESLREAPGKKNGSVVSTFLCVFFPFKDMN